MNRVVWKVVLPVETRPKNDPTLDYTFAIPIRARILACANQYGDISIWFEVDPESAPEPRRFALFGTGETIPPGYEYVGTTLHVGGVLVLHTYEAP